MQLRKLVHKGFIVGLRLPALSGSPCKHRTSPILWTPTTFFLGNLHPHCILWVSTCKGTASLRRQCTSPSTVSPLTTTWAQWCSKRGDYCKGESTTVIPMTNLTERTSQALTALWSVMHPSWLMQRMRQSRCRCPK